MAKSKMSKGGKCHLFVVLHGHVALRVLYPPQDSKFWPANKRHGVHLTRVNYRKNISTSLDEKMSRSLEQSLQHLKVINKPRTFGCDKPPRTATKQPQWPVQCGRPSRCNWRTLTSTASEFALQKKTKQKKFFIRNKLEKFHIVPHWKTDWVIDDFGMHTASSLLACHSAGTSANIFSVIISVTTIFVEMIHCAVREEKYNYFQYIFKCICLMVLLESINQSIDRSINQSINQSIVQSINQSIDR